MVCTFLLPQIVVKSLFEKRTIFCGFKKATLEALFKACKKRHFFKKLVTDSWNGL